jgi:hypothetical protein
MYPNLFFETIIFLFAILASSGIIYIFTISHLNTKNFVLSENFSVLTNRSEKDIIPITLLIGSNPIKLTSLESSASQTLSMTSSESKVSQTLTEISSETKISQEKFNSKIFINLQTDLNYLNFERNEGIIVHNPDLIEINTNELNTIVIGINEENMVLNQDTIPSDINEGFTSLDSLTILDRQTYDQWIDIVTELQDLPFNTAENIIQQVKLEELNILYSQDIIHYGITQTELRLIIETIPAIDLFNSDINHLILTMMSYFHL